jgi:hypothetical protein
MRCGFKTATSGWRHQPPDPATSQVKITPPPLARVPVRIAASGIIDRIAIGVKFVVSHHCSGLVRRLVRSPRAAGAGRYKWKDWRLTTRLRGKRFVLYPKFDFSLPLLILSSSSYTTDISIADRLDDAVNHVTSYAAYGFKPGPD